MHLNSLLFPAPKCSYNVEILKDELIWIPKHKRRPIAMNRLHTVGGENTYPLHTDTGTCESPRSLIPQLKSKKAMQFSPNVLPKAMAGSFNSARTIPKKLFVNDQQAQNHPQKLCKPVDILDMTIHSIQEVSSVCDEKGENSVLHVRENNLKFFADRNLNKNMDPPASYNVSCDDLDSPVQLLGGPMVLEKKFIITGPNVSTKSLKSNNTRDNSVFTDAENTPYLLPRAPLQKRKFSMKKEANTFNDGCAQEHKEGDFEERIVSEHSMDNLFFTPRNIEKYETKLFINPHNRAKLGDGTRKFLTEYLETSPEKYSRSYGSNFRERNSFCNTLGSDPLSFKDPVEYHIPCLVLRARSATNKVVLYFHGNGEDIHLARELLTHVRDHLNITVIAVEYPGYGLYNGAASEAQIQSDAETVYDYLTTKLTLHPKNIILFGRSIGSGPATWLASRRTIGALVLMSAFTSIRGVVQHLAGRWAQYLIKERFNNLECISRVTSPTFIVHGLKDRLIPFNHAQELYNKCKGLCELVLPKDMDHIEFDFFEDFTIPLIEFLNKINFGLEPKGLKINFPSELFRPPIDPVSKLSSSRSTRY